MLSIEYNDQILATMGLSEGEFAETARFLLAAQLHASGKLSAGQAAEFCGMEKVVFLHQLPNRGFPVSNLTEEDAEAELEFGRGK